MSKNTNSPIERLWNGALLLLGAVVAIALSLQVLAQIWGWLLLLLGVAGLVAGGVLVLRWWWSIRPSRW